MTEIAQSIWNIYDQDLRVTWRFAQWCIKNNRNKLFGNSGKKEKPKEIRILNVGMTHWTVYSRDYDCKLNFGSNKARQDHIYIYIIYLWSNIYIYLWSNTNIYLWGQTFKFFSVSFFVSFCFAFVFLFVCCLICRDRVLLCVSGSPRTHYVDQPGLEFTEIDLPTKCWY